MLPPLKTTGVFMADIVILGLADHCKPCLELKRDLDSENILYTFYDVKERGNPTVMGLKKELAASGHRTVPAVWIDGNFIGAGASVGKELLNATQ